MQAVILAKPGDGIEQLSLAELALPKASAKQVLIRVRYASLNPADLKLIANPPKTWQYPYVPGMDIVGEITHLGSACSRFKLGDMVATHGNLTLGGGLAEYVLQAEHTLFKIPAGFALGLAAAIPCAGLTAYQALVRKMNVKSGKNIFIQGGSGGVGSFAIIIAKALGLNVISSCSGKNADYVAKMGADIIIDYTKSDVYKQLKKCCPNGVDYILETTNKQNLQRDIAVLAFNGQLTSIIGVLDTKDIPEFALAFSFHEIMLGGAYLAFHQPSQLDLAQMGCELMSLLEKAGTWPLVTEYPLADFSAAFNDLAAHKHPGKIVVRVS